MICLVCNELINKNINYLNLFKVNKHKICESCFKKNLYIQRFEAIPLNNALLELHTLFEKVYEPLALMNFLQPYYKYYLSDKTDYLFLYFDSFDLNVYNNIHNIELGNIFLVTLNNIILEGE